MIHGNDVISFVLLKDLFRCSIESESGKGKRETCSKATIVVEERESTKNNEWTVTAAFLLQAAESVFRTRSRKLSRYCKKKAYKALRGRTRTQAGVPWAYKLESE